MRMTDTDHGITAADTIHDWAEHALRLDIGPELDEFGWERWGWEVIEERRLAPEQTDYEVVAEGVAGTEEQAEADAEAAKQSYMTSLIRK
jgi:hypothetical protein